MAHLAHRLQVTGRGDVGRSVTLAAVCMAAWQVEAGRRPVAPAGLGAGSLLDVTEIPFAAVAAAVAAFDDSALAWSRSPAGGTLQFEWPAALSVLPGRQQRSA